MFHECDYCFCLNPKGCQLKLDMANLNVFPASFYGEPGVLGMLANGISAFLVLLQNFNTARTGILPVGVENILAGKSSHPLVFYLSFVLSKRY